MTPTILMPIKKLRSTCILLMLFGMLPIMAQNGEMCIVDKVHGIAVCPADANKSFAGWAYGHLSNGMTLITNPSSTSASAGATANITFEGTTLKLWASDLPLLKLSTTATIVDEPKRGCSIDIIENGELRTHALGAEYRGFASQMLAKKNLDLEFWTDTLSKKSENVSIGGLRSDDDWVLNGMPEEPHRLRSKVGQQLWLDVARKPDFIDDDRAFLGARSVYAELSINGEYNGIYVLSEQIDRKQVRLQKSDDDLPSGMLFKADFWSDATQFLGAPAYDNSLPDWDRWEQKYPDNDDGNAYEEVYDVVNFVAQTNNITTQLDEYFNLANLVDHWLFMNLLLARDNMAPNNYLARYDRNTPWLYLVWDLDATFGNDWSGEFMPNDSIVLGNGLYSKLQSDPASNFRSCAKRRLQQLASGVYQQDNLTARFAAEQAVLTNSQVYQREALRWPEYPIELNFSPAVTHTIGRIGAMEAYLSNDVMASEAVCASNFAVSTESVPSNASKQWIIIDKVANQISSTGAVDYQVYNVMGQALQAGKASTIDMSSLSTGIYLIHSEGSTQRVFLLQ